jgi:hypothetical protein
VLTCFDATAPAGFSIKGTTLQGYDDKAIAKKLRKPEDVLPKVLSGGKRVLNRVMVDINSKEQKANGRLNKYMILLKVVR